jgi:hypothetical protein
MPAKRLRLEGRLSLTVARTALTAPPTYWPRLYHSTSKESAKKLWRSCRKPQLMPAIRLSSVPRWVTFSSSWRSTSKPHRAIRNCSVSIPSMPPVSLIWRFAWKSWAAGTKPRTVLRRCSRSIRTKPRRAWDWRSVCCTRTSPKLRSRVSIVAWRKTLTMRLRCSAKQSGYSSRGALTSRWTSTIACSPRTQTRKKRW